MLTKEELETPRSAAEMLEWVRGAHERFTQTKELREQAREGKHFAKQLIHEALPIALFAHNYFHASRDVLIHHVLANQKFDAKVEDRRNPRGRVAFIEITVSDWDYVESLRMELLSRDGHAPAYGPVLVEGPKRRRTRLEGTSDAYCRGELCENAIPRVLDAVRKKVQNEYPAGTALVVRVDDAGAFRESEDVERLEAIAENELIRLVERREFCVLCLLGSAGLYRVYDVQSGANCWHTDDTGTEELSTE